MRSEIRSAAAFLAVAIWADGFYSEEDRGVVLTEIAEALEVDAAELASTVDEAVKALESKNDDEVATYLIENASEIDEQDALVLMQCAIEIVLADNVITRDEVSTLLDLADATGSVEHVDVVLMIADLMKYCPEVEVELGTEEA